MLKLRLQNLLLGLRYTQRQVGSPLAHHMSLSDCNMVYQICAIITADMCFQGSRHFAQPA